jgi:hypothetical protein
MCEISLIHTTFRHFALHTCLKVLVRNVTDRFLKRSQVMGSNSSVATDLKNRNKNNKKCQYNDNPSSEDRQVPKRRVY